MVQRLQYIRIKIPLLKHFAGMPILGGVGVKNRENLPMSSMNGLKVQRQHADNWNTLVENIF